MFADDKFGQRNGVDGSNEPFETKFADQDIHARYIIIQDQFMRLSAEFKTTFLIKLFRVIRDHKYMRMFLNIAWKYDMGKCANYLHTLDASSYLNDIEIRDHNRNMREFKILLTFDENLLWFRSLYEPDIQLGLFLSFLVMGGNNVLRKVLRYMRDYYRTHGSTLNPFKEAEDKELTEKDLVCPSTQSLSSLQYVEELDEDDPDVKALLKRRKEWADNMAKYRKRIEKSIGFVPEPESKASSKSEKQPKDKAKAKPKKEKQEKSKPEIDFIQLLPVSVVLYIFNFLDQKTLKTIRKVNKYWDFIASNLTKEVKARKKLDGWIASLETEIGPYDKTSFKSQLGTPQFRFFRSDLQQQTATCNSKIRQSLAIGRQINANSLLIATISDSDIHNERPLPIRNMQAMCRFTRNRNKNGTLPPPFYLHKRPKCIGYDTRTYTLPPIETIPLVSAAVAAELETYDDIKSFNYIPSDIEMVKPPSLDNLYDDDIYNSHPFERNRELTRLLNKMITRSLPLLQQSRNEILSLSNTIKKMKDSKSSTPEDHRSFETLNSEL